MNLKAYARNTILASMYQCKQVVLLLALVVGLAFSSYAQTNPPAPTQMSAAEGPPCDPGDDGGGGGPSPPPGLCLPIDDYVYILMAVGVMYGCYKMRDFKTA